MRHSFVSLIFMLITFVTVCSGQDSTKTGNLTIILKGFDSNEGMAMIALSDTQEDYEAEEAAFRAIEAEIIDNSAVWIVRNIPYGEYAIKVYHDEDDDGEMDTNFLGVPSEDYGFSNDATGTFGPASWEDAKFLFNAPIDTMVINVD
jgi:uncharacterized protein (DUF2141 family)